MQDNCQAKQFQIDRLKRDLVEQVLSLSEQGGQAQNYASGTPRRLQILLEQRQKEDARAEYQRSILHNEAIKGLGVLQQQVVQLYNQVVKYQHKKAIANPLLLRDSGALDSALKSQPSNFDGIS